MAAYDVAAGAKRAAQAVTDFRAGTNPHWNDSYLDLGAQIMQSDMANAHELEMWNLNNAYNTPAAQMQRMKDAGLNPMLFYQQGNPGNSASAPGTHAPNGHVSPHQDTLNRILGAMQIIGSFNNMLSQAFGVTEQAYDVGLKRNELAWSNMDYSAASSLMPGFGHGRSASPGYRIVEGVAPDGSTTSSLTDSLDPFNPNFSPMQFRVLQKLGIPNYYPKQITAEANAYLSGKRAEYQDWYNTHFAPLMEQYQQGKIDYQELRNGMLEYEKNMLESLPPEFRAIIAPIFEYVRPFINSMIRH